MLGRILEGRLGSDRSKTRTAVLVSLRLIILRWLSEIWLSDEYSSEKMLANPEKTRREVLLFDYFKMMTLASDEKTGQSDKRPTVKSTTGVVAPANKIFSAAFSAIYKKHVFDRLTKSSGGLIQSRDITWIITVPTMCRTRPNRSCARRRCRAFPTWPELSNQNRFGARSRGTLLSRPAARTTTFPVLAPRPSLSDLLKTGSSFIVVDLGAGTADVFAVGRRHRWHH